MRPVPVGSKGNYTITVDEDHLASKLDASLARVMSTPTMVGIMEMAAINAIKQYYDLGETSVGASIEAEVTKSEGRRLEFSVRAFDEAEEVGSGIHRRAIIDAAKFNERLKPKIKAS